MSSNDIIVSRDAEDGLIVHFPDGRIVRAPKGQTVQAPVFAPTSKAKTRWDLAKQVLFFMAGIVSAVMMLAETSRGDYSAATLLLLLSMLLLGAFDRN